MKRIAFAAFFALALGGCFHEAALDQHLYGPFADIRGTNVMPLRPAPAPLIASSAQPAPPMRDPNAPEESLPAELANKSTAPAAQTAPTTPAKPN